MIDLELTADTLTTAGFEKAPVLMRGLHRANADENTANAGATVILASASDPRDRRLNIPRKCGVDTGRLEGPKAHQWDAVFARVRDEIADRCDDHGYGHGLLEHHVAPDSSHDAADICAMVAASREAREWASRVADAQPGESPLADLLILAAEQVAYSAAMREAADAARAVETPEPLADWEAELLGHTPQTIDAEGQASFDAWRARMHRVCAAALAKIAPVPQPEPGHRDEQVRALLLTRIARAEQAQEDGRKLIQTGADIRARAIHEAVVWGYGPRNGGRGKVAEDLGVTVGAVDQALRRARDLTPEHLPR